MAELKDDTMTMKRFRFITPEKPIKCPMFSKAFTAQGVRSAYMEITGLGLYRAFLNGRRVGDDWLTPGFNDYTAYLRFRRYDITPLLKEENELSVVLGDGWYKGRFGLSDLGGDVNIFGSQHMLAVRIVLTGNDGQTREIGTDESWIASCSPILDSSIYDGETRDDTRPAGEGVSCVPVDPPCEPEEDAAPAIRVKAVLRPILIISPKGEQILDFGQNMAGVVRFANRLPKGRTIRLRHFEVLQDGCFFADNLRSAKAEYVYTSDGKTGEIEPFFTFYGFRYVMAEGLDRVDPDDFRGLVLSSDLKETLRVETDSPKINQLMRNTLWSQRGNFLDVPTDCPQRDERLGWTGDAQVFAATACRQMDCKAFYRKYMRDLRVDQTRYYGGDIPMFSPSLRGKAGAGGAAWADAAAIIPWQVYLQYGDLGLLRETYPLMRDYALNLIRQDLKDGSRRLITEGFAFGDWLALDGITEKSMAGGTDLPFIQSVYCMHSIRLAALAAGELGQREDRDRFTALADEIRAAILNEYFTPGGRLSVDTQTAYALALHFELYTDAEVIRAQLKQRLLRDQFILKTGFVGTPLILPALLDHGMEEEAYRLLYREAYPSWLYAVNLGATTIWERWNSMLPDGRVSDTGMNSFNHYANGSVCEAIYGHIAGLRVLQPGWKAALISPKPNRRMKSISLAFESPAGPYAVAWQINDDGTFALQAQVPAGASARVILPLHPENLQMNLPAGQHNFHYTPTQDLLHPYHAGTLTQDLMANAEAAKALEKHVPGFYYAAVSGNVDFLMMTPEEAVGKLPFLRQYDLRALDSALKAIRA